MTDSDEVRRRALRLLARRPHSRRQLRRKLARSHSAKQIASVLDDLQEVGLLDDLSVALDRARYCRHQRKWGDARLRADLRRLGIDAKMIDSVLLRLDQHGSEQDALDSVVQTWIGRRGRPETVAELKKLFDHCSRRGFPSGKIRECLGPFWSRVEWDNG